MLLLEIYLLKCSVACCQFHQFRTLINELITNIKRIVLFILMFTEQTPLWWETCWRQCFQCFTYGHYRRVDKLNNFGFFDKYLVLLQLSFSREILMIFTKTTTYVNASDSFSMWIKVIYFYTCVFKSLI